MHNDMIRLEAAQKAIRMAQRIRRQRAIFEQACADALAQTEETLPKSSSTTQ
jgi:hypothetical protein